MTPLPPERYHTPLQRIVLPEILDSLPAEHPDAICSRKDLYRINLIMGNYRFLKRELYRHVKTHDSCVEIGAGGGQLFTVLPHRNQTFSIGGLDLAPRPDHWPEAWQWHQQDLFHSSLLTETDLIMASLILHHFEDTQLMELGKKLTAHARVLLITEPLRNSSAHSLARLAEWTGIHPVTRHDMHVSIDAGFRIGELPELLSLTAKKWQIQEWCDWRGSLRMVAFRK